MTPLNEDVLLCIGKCCDHETVMSFSLCSADIIRGVKQNRLLRMLGHLFSRLDYYHDIEEKAESYCDQLEAIDPRFALPETKTKIEELTQLQIACVEAWHEINNKIESILPLIADDVEEDD